MTALVALDDAQHNVFDRSLSCAKLTGQTVRRIGGVGGEGVAFVCLGGQQARVSLLDTDLARGTVRGPTGQRDARTWKLIDHVDQRLRTRELDFLAARFETNAYHASPL